MFKYWENGKTNNITKKEGDILFFLFIFLMIIALVITIKIKIEIQNIKFLTNEKPHLNRKYEIKIKIYTFGIIPIFNIKLNNRKIQKIMKNQKIKEKIKQKETKIIENKANIDKELITSLKNIQTEIEEINLKILIGTENASLTAFTIPVISTVIAMFLNKQIRKYNDKQVFLVAPVYIDKNLINVEFSGIFQIKMIHIINTICIINKKRKGGKNERTSNRRPYDYGYE